jgi:hypothetical protein
MFMNKTNYILRGAATLLFTVFLTASCTHRQQISDLTVEHCLVDTVAPLQTSANAPACSVKVDFCFLAPSTETSGSDSVFHAINTSVVAQLLGEDYASLPVGDAVNLFKTNYLNDYRQDMQEMYAADLKNQVAENELPSWYNRSFELKTEMSAGRKGILCTTADIYEFAGGAHPNSWVIWMNHRLTDGHLLTTDEVFLPTLQDELSARLLEALLPWARKTLDNKDIATIADLQNEGLLLTSQLYVPENFLLGEDEVKFIYNRYDIAPYALGAIELSLPYKQVEDLMDWEAVGGKEE